mgnify:CR=1 FL=1
MLEILPGTKNPFDQLLSRLPPDEPEEPLFVEATYVPRVVPASTEGLLRQFLIPPVSVKHQRSPDKNFTRRSRRALPVEFVHDL